MSSSRRASQRGSMRVARPAIIAGASTWLLAAPLLGAQSPERNVAAGLGVPVGGLGASRSFGPVLRGGVTFGDLARRHVRLRLDVEGGWLQGDSLASSGSWRGGTLASFSGFATMLVGATSASERAGYALLGLGVQRLAIASVNNPYGTTAAVRLGAGMHFRAGGRNLFAEIVPTLSLTDFGNASDVSIGTVIPLVVGVRF